MHKANTNKNLFNWQTLFYSRLRFLFLLEKTMHLRDRVALRMEKLGLNSYGLAAILRDQYQLPTIRQSTIHALISGRTETFRRMTELAAALHTNIQWLLNGSGEEELSGLQPQVDNVIEKISYGPDTVPIIGQSGILSVLVNIKMANEVGKALRHPNQQGRNDAYDVEVWDNSMSPRYESGELATVLSEKRPKEGQDCYIFFSNGTVELRKLIKETGKSVEYCQLNPYKEWAVRTSEIKAMHAVVGRIN